MSKPTGVRGISITAHDPGGKVWRVQISAGGRENRRRDVYLFRGRWGDALEDGIRRRDGGMPSLPTTVTLDGYFEARFLPNKARKRSRTVETYEETWRLYVRPVLGAVRVRDLIDDDQGIDTVRAWVSWLASPKASRSGRTLSPRSQQKAIRCLSAVLRHACRGKRRAMNPLEAIGEDDLPTVNYRRAGRRRAVSHEVAEAIVRAFDGHPFDAAVALALGGGLRRGEVLGVPLDALRELPDGRIEVTVRQVVVAVRHGVQIEQGAKTDGSLRTLVLPAWASAKVRRQITATKALRIASGARWEDHGLLFPRTGLRGCGGRHKPGAPMYPSTFTRAFKTHLLDVGLGEIVFDGLAALRLHDLRHTAASLAAEAGIPLALIGRRLGHVRAETTQGYVDPDAAADQRVADAFESLGT